MNLLMLTKFYPFGTGEAFIENEIKVLSEQYDNITIIACEVGLQDTTIRTLPDNVKAYKINASSKKIHAIYGAKYLFSSEYDISKERKECNSLLAKIFLSYFESKSQNVFNKILDNHYLDDIVKEPFVLYSYWFFMTARVGTLIAERYKPIYMFTRAHRYDLYEEKNVVNYLPYRKLFLNTYDNVLTCSNNGTEHLKRRYPSLSKNVITSLLGTLDYGVGKASDDGIFRIVSCSRMEKVKRVSRIIEALHVLDSENIQIEWTHIGGGSEFENIKREATEKLINIKFNLLGNMKNSDVMNLYINKPFDLFINVSSSEGLPVSIMEAISFGIPVVATDVGGTSEIVIDYLTGKLISSEFSKEELVSTIKNFATTGRLTASRKIIREFWEKNFQAIPNYRYMCDFIKSQYLKK